MASVQTRGRPPHCWTVVVMFNISRLWAVFSSSLSSCGCVCRGGGAAAWQGDRIRFGH